MVYRYSVLKVFLSALECRYGRVLNGVTDPAPAAVATPVFLESGKTRNCTVPGSCNLSSSPPPIMKDHMVNNYSSVLEWMSLPDKKRCETHLTHQRGRRRP